MPVRQCFEFLRMFLLLLALAVSSWLVSSSLVLVSDSAPSHLLPYTQLAAYPSLDEELPPTWSSESARRIALSTTQSAGLYKSAMRRLAAWFPRQFAWTQEPRDRRALRDLSLRDGPAWSSLYHNEGTGSLLLTTIEPMNDTGLHPTCVVRRYRAEVKEMLSRKWFTAQQYHGIPTGVPGTKDWRMVADDTLSGGCLYIEHSADRALVSTCYETVRRQSKTTILRVYAAHAGTFPEITGAEEKQAKNTWSEATGCGNECYTLTLPGSLLIRALEWIADNTCIAFGRLVDSVEFRTVCFRTRRAASGEVAVVYAYGGVSTPSDRRKYLANYHASTVILHEAKLPLSSTFCNCTAIDPLRLPEGLPPVVPQEPSSPPYEGGGAACGGSVNGSAEPAADGRCRPILGVRLAAANSLLLEVFYRQDEAPGDEPAEPEGGGGAWSADWPAHVDFGLWDESPVSLWNRNVKVAQITVDRANIFGRQLKASSADGAFLALTLLDDTLIIFDVGDLLNASKKKIDIPAKTQEPRSAQVLHNVALQGSFAWSLVPPGIMRTLVSEWVKGDPAKEPAKFLTVYQRAVFTRDGRYLCVVTRHSVQVFKRQKAVGSFTWLAGLWGDEEGKEDDGEGEGEGEEEGDADATAQPPEAGGNATGQEEPAKGAGESWVLRWTLPRGPTGSHFGMLADVYDVAFFEEDGMMYLLVLYERGLLLSYPLEETDPAQRDATGEKFGSGGASAAWVNLDKVVPMLLVILIAAGRPPGPRATSYATILFNYCLFAMNLLVASEAARRYFAACFADRMQGVPDAYMTAAAAGSGSDSNMSSVLPLSAVFELYRSCPAVWSGGVLQQELPFRPQGLFLALRERRDYSSLHDILRHRVATGNGVVWGNPLWNALKFFVLHFGAHFPVYQYLQDW